MNSATNLSARLLRQYPVKVVKEHFNIEEQLLQYDLIREIATNKRHTDVVSFAVDSINKTKQHIYIYDIRRFNSRKFNEAGNEFPLEIVKELADGGTHNYYCVPKVTFSATIKNLQDNTYEEINMVFKQPLIVTITGSHLIIRATILEKNVGAYMGAENKAFDVKKDVDDDFVSIVTSYLIQIGCQINVCDLNKGVKHLCQNDVIDFKYVKYKKTRSTTTEVMDEDYTLKGQYPDDFKKLMMAPLNKSVFKYLGQDKEIFEHFTADPSSGQISVTLFPDDENQVTNVVNQIIRNN